MGAQGTVLLDFGPAPGASDTSIAVTGQGAIVSGSLVEAWLRLEPTVDHSADEHMLEQLHVSAGNVVAGVGFTIYGVGTNELNDPVSTPMPYGKWTVAWVWN